jgi:hypothetical protein
LLIRPLDTAVRTGQQVRTRLCCRRGRLCAPTGSLPRCRFRGQVRKGFRQYRRSRVVCHSPDSCTSRDTWSVWTA